MIILILAANSSFNDSPAGLDPSFRDSYMPHQNVHDGRSAGLLNGVIILGVFSCLLIIPVQRRYPCADSALCRRRISPLHDFSRPVWSSAGSSRRAALGKKLLVNGIGAVTTAIATVIIASTKFTHGAWIVIVLIPLC